MKISVVIPNYNGENLIKKNLPPLLKVLSSYKEYSFQVIYPDDASHDNSIEVLKQFKKENTSKNIDIEYIENKKNLGFSSNIDRGIKVAQGEFIFLLNTDVVPEIGFLEPLLKDLEDKNVFAVGCMDKSEEGNETVLRGRGIGQWKRGFLIHSRGDIDKNDTLWVSGGSSMVRKSIMDVLNSFDTIFDPFYWEDIDLSFRAQKMGYITLFEKMSIVEHHHAEGSIKRHYTASQVKTIAYRNQFVFIWKNITDIDLLLSHFFYLPYHIVKAILRRDRQFLHGLFLALTKIPDIIKKRNKQKKLFTHSDKDILNKFKS